jgi:CBS domain containing-hemolysin-like protein
MNWQAFLWGLVGFLLTVMVLSYLIGDNFFFRLASALFVGLTAGYSAVLILDQILGPHLWNPLISGSWPTRLLTLVPLILIGLLALSQFSRFTKLGTIPLAFLGGLVAALTIGGAVFGTLVPQAEAVINRFDLELWRGGKASAWVQIVEALIMLLGTVTTLSYFHFSRRKPTTPGEKLSERPKIMVGLGKMGQVFIGITLGAIFAGVFSTALFALINRISFITQFFARWIGGL